MNRPTFWDSSFSVNIAELDRQHQKLLCAILELEDALRADRAHLIIDTVMQDVIEHMISHFADEEELMRRHGFPGLADHCAEHQKIAQQITKFNLSNLAGGPDIPAHFLVFLQGWLQEHILKTDKEYSAFLNAKGVY